MLTRMRHLPSRVASAALAGLLVVGVTSLAALPTFGADRGGEAAPAPEDPFDARHVALDLVVATDVVEVERIGVGIGVAAGSPAATGALQVRLLDGKGATLSVLWLPDPLEQHIYDLATTDGGPSSDVPAQDRAHETNHLDKAQVQLTIPLRAQLSGVEIVRTDATGSGSVKRGVDLVADIAAACRNDDHRDCRDWLSAH